MNHKTATSFDLDQLLSKPEGPSPLYIYPVFPHLPRCRIVNITKLQKVSLMYRHYFRRMFLYFETKVCNFFI